MKIVHFYWHPASKIAVRLPQDLHNYRLYFFQQNHAQLRETTVKHLFLNHSFCLLIPWSQAFVESGVLWIYHLLPLLLTHNIRGVRVEEYAYYVNKLRRNFGLETLKWRQIVTSQTAHTKYKWPPYVTAWNPPWKFSAHATVGCVWNCIWNDCSNQLCQNRGARDAWGLVESFVQPIKLFIIVSVRHNFV